MFKRDTWVCRAYVGIYRVQGLGCPKIRGTNLGGVSMIRAIIAWGLYWGPPFWEVTMFCNMSHSLNS